MKRFLWLFFLLPLQLMGNMLSDNSTISILTCMPGNMLYSQFGHSAVRVKDDIQNLDIVFNYGTFDFNTPNFYLKFIHGKLHYMLTISHFENFKASYISGHRSIYEQKLYLNIHEKQQIFDALNENFKPENRYYLYDFLYDNCATRVRDIIEKNLEENISYNYEKSKEEVSFMHLLKDYLQKSPWIRLSFDLLLGESVYKSASPYDKMFLPDYIMYNYQGATYKDSSLTQQVQTIFKSTTVFPGTSRYFSPTFIFSVILAVIMLLRILRCYPDVFDIAIFMLTGILGLSITFLWFATDHDATKWNLHILWLFPLNFIVVFFLLKKNNLNRLIIYLKFIVLLLFVMFVYLMVTIGKYEAALYILFIIVSHSLIRITHKTILENNKQQANKTLIQNP